MDRHIIGSVWNRVNRNGLNANFKFLFEETNELSAVKQRIDDAESTVNIINGRVSSLIDLNTRTNELLDQAEAVNEENKSVQAQLDRLVIESGNPNTELSQARGEYELLVHRLDADKSEVLKKIENLPSVLPSFQGRISSKVIQRVNEHDYYVYSKKPKSDGFVSMRFRDDQSVNGSGDAGDPGDLMRLVGVRDLDVANLYKHEYSNGSDNLRETLIYTDSLRNDVWVNDANNVVRAGDFIEFEVTSTSTNTATDIALVSSNQSDPNAKLIVDGEEVARLDLSEPGTGINNIIRHRIFFSTSGTHTIRVESTQNANKFYVLGVNYGAVGEQSKDLEYDTLQTRETGNHYITNVGANDYAMRDEDDFKLAGSYHGGEARVSLDWYADNEKLELEEGRSKVVNKLTLEQVTDLRGKLTSETITDLSYDGAYSFTAHLYGTMNISTLYTSMTCTHTDFSDVVFPKRWSVPVTSSVNDYEIKRSQEVIQRNPDTNQTVTTMLTTFGNNPPSEKTFIRHASSGNFPYNKHYHAYNHQDEQVIRDITFRSVKVFD